MIPQTIHLYQNDWVWCENRLSVVLLKPSTPPRKGTFGYDASVTQAHQG